MAKKTKTNVSIDELLTKATQLEASDLHLNVGLAPYVRINGELGSLRGYEAISNRELREMIFDIISKDQKFNFFNEKELDFAHAIKNGSRFRINIFWERGNIGLAARVIPSDIPAMEDILMPEVAYDLITKPMGLFLVTGPTGHGKSTSVASMLNRINQEMAKHIVTLEDPIEFVYTPIKSIITQRELGSDMMTFASGLKHVLRQDPNVILVGEMRDPETIATTITLAETGHLVFATLHTNSAAQTIDRIIDTFPPHQQNQIKLQLSMVLKAVISQRLLKSTDGGRVAVREVMLNSPAISNLIRENKITQIDNVIQTSAKEGMISMEQALRKAYKEGLITKEAAAEHIDRAQAF